MSDELPRLPQESGGLSGVLQESQDFADKQREEAQKQPLMWSSEMGEDGQTYDTLKLHRSLTNQIMSDLKWKNETMAAFHQEIERVDRQKKSGNPLLDALATISGELAQDPRLPPFVSALGRASEKLNPTQAELSNRQLGLMEALSRFSGQETERMQATERTGLERRRIEDEERKTGLMYGQKASDAEDKRMTGLEREVRLMARNQHPMSDQNFGFWLKNRKVTDPQKIEELTAVYKDEARTYAEAEKDKRKSDMADYKAKAEIKAQEQHQNRVDAYGFKEKYALFTADKQKEFAQYKESLKKDERLSLMTDKNKDKLAAAQQTELYLNDLQKMLNKPEIQSVPGFGALTLRELPRYLKGDDRVQLENMIAHETPRVLQGVLGLQGGVRILQTKEGRKMLSDLGISLDAKMSQVPGLMSNIRGTMKNTRISIAQETPRADYRPFKGLFGSDYDAVLTAVRQGDAGAGEKKYVRTGMVKGRKVGMLADGTIEEIKN